MSSHVIQLHTGWKGFTAIRNLVIFGDSYSAVGYAPNLKESHPSPERPLGVDFPGITYNEAERPNWVGHLITSFIQGRNDILVYDYAKGGATAPGIVQQALHGFLPHVGQRPEWATWSALDTIFITWVGINDCAFLKKAKDVQKPIERVFDVQDELYALGARCFLFVDVPPIERSPALSSRTVVKRNPTIFEAWNAQLMMKAREFAASHQDATILLFSAWRIFSSVLDDPAAYGFAPDSSRQRGGDIWFDQLHPTSAMHAVIAKEVSDFLYTQALNQSSTKI